MATQQAFSSGSTETVLTFIHDSIQRIGFAQVTHQQAEAFQSSDSPEGSPYQAFIWKMFGLGFAISYEEEEQLFIITNAPETSK
jgi:hypothetical protein